MISLIEPRERQYGRVGEIAGGKTSDNDFLTQTYRHTHTHAPVTDFPQSLWAWTMAAFRDKPRRYLLEISLSYKFHESCCTHFFEVSIKCALVRLACLNLSLWQPDCCFFKSFSKAFQLLYTGTGRLQMCWTCAKIWIDLLNSCIYQPCTLHHLADSIQPGVATAHLFWWHTGNFQIVNEYYTFSAAHLGEGTCVS